MKTSFSPGDILSYSASSKQSGPEGYRILSSSVSYLPDLIQRWPILGQALGTKIPMIINAYPASLGHFPFGIFVDTYLSVQTGLRALKLAAQEGLPALVMGQPLFLAELIFRGLQQKIDWPQSLILASGGYTLPQSLQAVLTQRMEALSVMCLFLHCYGLAEVDAACLVGVERNAQGDIIYHPRNQEIHTEVFQKKLFIGYEQAEQKMILWDTGDFAQFLESGLIIKSAMSRLDPIILNDLEGWSEQDWERRTGYLQWKEKPLYQLREGLMPQSENELSHYSFADKFSFSWLRKPDWNLN